jgi:hypothetical protein
MVGGARWILIGTALMLVAGALLLSCGGGNNQNCVIYQGGVAVNVCAGSATPGPFLQSISLCPGTPATPTPVPTSGTSASPTPIETACPVPAPTTVPLNGTVFFHAVGTFSNAGTQDITNNASTNWTSNDPTSVIANTGLPGTSTPPGSFFAAGVGSAEINASSAGISGPGAEIDVLPTPTVIPTATPTPSPIPTPVP